MKTAQQISEDILKAIADTGSITLGFDRVMGEGAYAKLASETYDALNVRGV